MTPKEQDKSFFPPGQGKGKARESGRGTLFRPTGFLLVMVLICATAIGVITGSATAAVAAALDCTTRLYEISPGALKVVSVPFSAVGNAASVTATDEFTVASGVSNPNSLGINSDGTKAYYTADRGGSRVIVIHDTATGADTERAARNSPGYQAGAVNPVTGIFYYGTTAANGVIFAYNPATGASFQAGTVPAVATSAPGGLANGDYAFSSGGDLLIVSNNRIVSVPAAAVPTAESTTQLPGTLVSEGDINTSVGIAFDDEGTLYVLNGQGAGAGMQRVNPVTGAVVGQTTTTSVVGSDLASCAPPSTLTLQKNVSDRVNAADQFTLNISSAGASGISATTTGSAKGVQAEKAGPTIGLAGTVYTLSESGASGTDLSAYDTTYQCVDTSRSNEVIASGSSRSFSLTYPTGTKRGVVCTFTNTPRNWSYTVEKSVDATTAHPGTALTYTVEVKNTGDAAYDDNAPSGLRRVSFTDDLSGVLDDATYNNDASNGATVSGTTLSWSGTLAKGETKTITYSVTPNKPGNGDLQLDNKVTPSGPHGTCVPNKCATSTPVQALEITKTADKQKALPGSTITYTIAVKNTGKVAYTAGSDAASFTDDLSKVLDDADYNNDASATDGTVSYAQPKLDWSGPVAVGQTVTVTYSVTVKNPDTGDSDIDNAVISRTPGNNCVPDSGDPKCQIAVPSQSFTVSKTSSTTVASPGDTVTYTVTVTNTGKVDYTSSNPASFRDDLSNVTDDATYVAGSATNGAVVEGNTLAWSGGVAVGQSTTVTYEVKVNAPDTGDRKLINTVTPASPDGRCTTAAECTTITNVRTYTVEKRSSRTTVNPGQTVSYTVTVKNTGTADYTAQAPAAFDDDLSKVLDDATYNGDASNGATVSGTTLSWSGPLAVGASQQITYTVTVNNPDTGDKVLTNAVSPTGPGGDCAAAGSCTTTTNVQSFTVEKVASVGKVTPGATLTYTVKVINTGTAAYTSMDPASFTDDLARVVDDATYNGDAVSSSDGGDPGVVRFTTPTLSWTGPLAVGATTTVTYTVTVNTPNSGDGILTNAVVPNGPGGGCAPGKVCTTTTPVQSITFAKVADRTDVVPGEVVTYTITVTNTGKVDYTSAAPATFTDDLTNVVDDATYNRDATSTAGTVSYMQPTLSWSGPVAAGETVTVTYTVTVNTPDTGDKVLDNAVLSDVPGSGCAPGSTDPACRSVLPSGEYTVTKTASTTTANQGATVMYTVTVTNTGKTAYTAARPASFQDNMIHVLDDATYNNDARASGGSVSYNRPNLNWSGPLAVGGTVTVTYSVTVNTPDTGDRKIVNAVAPTSPGGQCSPQGCSTTTTVPPGFKVHTGGDAAATASISTGGWMGLSVTGIAALVACLTLWVRRRPLGASQ